MGSGWVVGCFLLFGVWGVRASGGVERRGMGCGKVG